MELDAVRLLRAAAAGHEAVAQDRQLAEDDEAFQAMAAAGAELLRALEAVDGDKDFWKRLRIAAAGSVLLPAVERDALETLLDAELAAVLEALRYAPPPPVYAFIEDTLDAVARACSSQLSSEERVERIDELKYQLAKFSFRLRGLIGDTYTRAPVRRRRLRRAVYKGSGTAAALAIAGVGLGLEAGVGAIGAGAAAAKLGGKLGEMVAQALSERARAELAEGLAPEGEALDRLAEIDPVARQKAFARVLESRIARGVMGYTSLEETADSAFADVDRIERCAHRVGGRSHALIAALQQVRDSLGQAHQLARSGELDAARAALAEAGKWAQAAGQVVDPVELERIRGDHARAEAERAVERAEAERAEQEEQSRLTQERQARLREIAKAQAKPNKLQQ